MKRQSLLLLTGLVLLWAVNAGIYSRSHASRPSKHLSQHRGRFAPQTHTKHRRLRFRPASHFRSRAFGLRKSLGGRPRHLAQKRRVEDHRQEARASFGDRKRAVKSHKRAREAHSKRVRKLSHKHRGAAAKKHARFSEEAKKRHNRSKKEGESKHQHHHNNKGRKRHLQNAQDSQNLVDGKPNPFMQTPAQIDSSEAQVRAHMRGPKTQGLPINFYDKFGRDPYVTQILRDLFRSNQLHARSYDYSLVDRSYFYGSSRNVGNPAISDIQAITEMNYDQYFSHLQKIMGDDRENQKLASQYQSNSVAQRRMLNLRRTKRMVWRSILGMEDSIYREQQKLTDVIAAKEVEFEKKARDDIQANLQRLYGVPFFPKNPDPKDIFV